MKLEFLYRKYTFIVMKMIKNILFEVLPIASYTFFPAVWKLVEATPKKTVALLKQTSHRAIFVHFHKK